MLAAVLLIIFLLVVIVGVPISFAMGFMTISAFTIGNGAMVIIPQKMFSGVYNFTYMCIPLFILASEIMSRCGLTMSSITSFGTAFIISVSVIPGATALTRIPLGPSSLATSLLNL